MPPHGALLWPCSASVPLALTAVDFAMYTSPAPLLHCASVDLIDGGLCEPASWRAFNLCRDAHQMLLWQGCLCDATTTRLVQTFNSTPPIPEFAKNGTGMWTWALRRLSALAAASLRALHTWKLLSFPCQIHCILHIQVLMIDCGAGTPHP